MAGGNKFTDYSTQAGEKNIYKKLFSLLTKRTNRTIFVVLDLSSLIYLFYNDNFIYTGRAIMDVIRRNTDYAVRLAVHLAKHHGKEPISTRAAAAEEHVPYQLACKLMQKLNNAKLVTSCMGPKGGFVLAADPIKVSLLDVIKVIQGPVNMNRCLLGEETCPKQKSCAVRGKLASLQKNINSGLADITLDELTHKGPTKKKFRNTKRVYPAH